MKCLSIRQPWASLVIMGIKTIETRSWSSKYRGVLLIHAGVSEACKQLFEEEPFAMHFASRNISSWEELPRGKILGSVLLQDIQPVDKLAPSSQEFLLGDYSAGRFGWLLAAPTVLVSPIKCPGTLGLFDVQM